MQTFENDLAPRPTAYAPPRAPQPVDLRLDRNEGPLPLVELRAAPGSGALRTLREYPATAELERELAASLGIEPDRVLVTAGADDALFRIALGLCGGGRSAVLPTPTFEMIPRYLALAGAETLEVQSLAPAYPTDAVLREVREDTACVFCVTPNNPTGSVARFEDVERLSRALGSGDGRFLICDLAYAEFASEDWTRRALELENVLCVRTFSKAFGLAGLRVGWVAGPAGAIARLRAHGHPFPVAGTSVALAREAWARRAELVPVVRATRERRERIASELRALGVDPLPSAANFLLARDARADWIACGLRGLGIAVRSFADQPLLEDAFRIAVPATDDELERVLRALRTVLAPEALLCDLDDVLRATTPDALTRTRRLAVVSARPRRDAERVLADAGLRDAIDAVVCREEAASEPAVVRLALRRLGVERAWRFCGTPGDVRGARAAGVCPIGVLAPDAAPETARDLLRAGAARVVRGLDAWEDPT